MLSVGHGCDWVKIRSGRPRWRRCSAVSVHVRRSKQRWALRRVLWQSEKALKRCRLRRFCKPPYRHSDVIQGPSDAGEGRGFKRHTRRHSRCASVTIPTLFRRTLEALLRRLSSGIFISIYDAVLGVVSGIGRRRFGAVCSAVLSVLQALFKCPFWGCKSQWLVPFQANETPSWRRFQTAVQWQMPLGVMSTSFQAFKRAPFLSASGTISKHHSSVIR